MEAENAASYMKTKFFRFLVSMLKISPIATSQVYRLIPMVPFDRSYVDEDLYSMFSLTGEQIEHIESKVSSWKA